MSSWKHGPRRREGGILKKQSVVTEETETYPPHPLSPHAPLHLSGHEKFIVAFNRILLNYWKTESPFRENSPLDFETQHQLLLESSNPSLFPQELLESKMSHVMPKKLPSLKKLLTQKNPMLLEQNQHNEDENEQNPQDNEEPEDNHDFGGDDYAVDYLREDLHDDVAGDEPQDDDMFL